MGKFILILTSQRNGSLLSTLWSISTGNGTTEHQEPLSSQFSILQIYTFNDKSSLVPLPYEAI